MQQICRKVGEGNCTRFWKDKWMGNEPFSQTFRKLLLSTQKNNFINELGSWLNRVWYWELNWRRALSDRD